MLTLAQVKSSSDVEFISALVVVVVDVLPRIAS